MTENLPGRGRPSPAPAPAVVGGAILFLVVGALCLYLGLERAEKIMSIAGAVAGMAGTALMVHQLFRRQAAQSANQQADRVPGPPGSGGIAAGGNVHVGHKVNTGGILAVGGILATLYLVLGTAGVVNADPPKVSLTELVGTWRSAGGTIDNGAGLPKAEQQDTVLTVRADGRFTFSMGMTMGPIQQNIRCAGEVAEEVGKFDFLSSGGQCPGTFTGQVAADGRYVRVVLGEQTGQSSVTLRRVR